MCPCHLPLPGFSPSYIYFDLISILFGSYNLSFFPACPVNSCVRAGFSLQLWAVLAFLAFKDFPSRQSVLVHYYFFFKWCPLFSGFSRHLFWNIVTTWSPSGLYRQAFSFFTSSNTDGKKGFHRLHNWTLFVIRPWIPLDIKMQKTCLGDCLW